MDNPLWEFSCSRYEQHEVASICLRLQDHFNIDVNILLYAAWVGAEGLGVTQPHVAALDASIVSWRERVVIPLRSLRQQWRDFPPADALRENLKALELLAERQQQDLIYDYYLHADEKLATVGSIGRNLALVSAFYSPRDHNWSPAIAALSALLEA